MDSVKKFIAYAVLALIALYGATKYYVYDKAQEAFKDLSRTAEAFGHLEYDGISTNLLGKLSYTGVRFSPFAGHDDVLIDSITLKTPGFGNLLKLGSLMEEGELPKRMELDIQGITFPMNADFLDPVEKAVNEYNESLPNLRSNCGGLVMFAPSHYRAMGYDQLKANLTVGYSYNQLAYTIEAYIKTRTEAMDAVNVKFTLADVTSRRVYGLTKRPPYLKRIEISYEDLSLTQRSNTYCAKADGTNVTAYIDSELKQGDDYYQTTWGFIPGPGLRTAYRDFLSHPGTATLTLRPPKSINPKTIALYDPSDLPSVLDMTLEVNGKPVHDLSITPAHRAIQVETPLLSLLKPEEEKTDEKPRSSSPRKVITGEYRAVNVEDADHYVGQLVRIETDDHKRRSGWLEKTTPNTLFVEKELYGGTFAVQVPRHKIAHMEAYFVTAK